MQGCLPSNPNLGFPKIIYNYWGVALWGKKSFIFTSYQLAYTSFNKTSPERGRMEFKGLVFFLDANATSLSSDSPERGIAIIIFCSLYNIVVNKNSTTPTFHGFP